MTDAPFAESDAATYCGAEFGEVREGECECPRCSVEKDAPAETCYWREPHRREPDGRVPNSCGWRTLHAFQPTRVLPPGADQ